MLWCLILPFFPILFTDLRSPPGSILGPLIFNLYKSSFSAILSQFPGTFHIYADNMQLVVLEPFSDIENLIPCVSSWVTSRSFLLNTSNLNSSYLMWLVLLLSLPPFLPQRSSVIFGFSSIPLYRFLITLIQSFAPVVLFPGLYPIRACLDEASAILLIKPLFWNRSLQFSLIPCP